jgi:hypothetical protein
VFLFLFPRGLAVLLSLETLTGTWFDAVLDQKKLHLREGATFEEKKQFMVNTLLKKYPTVLPRWFQKHFPDPQTW